MKSIIPVVAFVVAVTVSSVCMADTQGLIVSGTNPGDDGGWYCGGGPGGDGGTLDWCLDADFTVGATKILITQFGLSTETTATAPRQVAIYAMTNLNTPVAMASVSPTENVSGANAANMYAWHTLTGDPVFLNANTDYRLVTYSPHDNNFRLFGTNTVGGAGIAVKTPLAGPVQGFSTGTGVITGTIDQSLPNTVTNNLVFGNAFYAANFKFRVIPNGDANWDSAVNFSDYLILEQTFNTTVAPGVGADFNRDGSVNFSDYLMLEQNFNTVAAVPEPMTLSLLGLGALALIRRKK